jgi:hypothetical protein
LTTQRIGAFEYYDPSGKKVTHVPNSITTYGTGESQNVTAPLLDTQSRIISDYLLFSAFTKFVVSDTDTLKDAKFDFIRNNNPIEPVTASFREVTVQLQLEYLEQMEQTLEADRQKEEIIKENLETYKQTAVFDFDGFIADVIEIGVDYVLEQVNKLLPPGYRLDVDVRDGEFVGISIAGISYNAQTNVLSYDGRLFDALLRDGLDILNDILPDFLQAELGLNNITFGSISIDFDELEEGVEFPVFGDISISKVGGDIQVNVFGRKISVFNTLVDIASRQLGGLISRGLASINSQLPEGLKVGVAFGKDSLLPTVSLGPVSLDTSTGRLSLNVASLNSLIDRNLNKYVFRQLPGPLGAIARRAWKALDLGALFEEIIPPTPPSPESSITINVMGESALPPLISSPPMVGDFPMENTTNDIA